MIAEITKGRIPWMFAFWCTIALALGQLLTGTASLHVQLVFLCAAAGFLAVNLLGGAGELPGFCVLVMLLKVVLVAQWVKVIFGEPADAPLMMPHRTMLALVAGMLGILAAAACCLPFRFKSAAIKPITSPSTLRLAGLLTYAMGTLCCAGSIAAGGEDGMLQVGGLAGAMRQLTFTSKLAVVFTTAAVILGTDRRHSVSWLNGLPILTLFGYGILTASKQAMLDPFVLYGLTVLAFGYRLRVKHWAAVAAMLVIAQLVLFPFAQSARNVIRVFGLKKSFQATSEFLTEFYRGGWQDAAADHEEHYSETAYFNRSAGLVERFGMIRTVDLLVTQTDLHGESGWTTITHGFSMLIPRFLNPGKPMVNTGNFLGHKARLLGENDEGTQVSFGFIADAYSAFGLTGAFLVSFCIVTGFTLVYRRLIGPLPGNVWAVYLFAEYQHTFSEQTIASMIITICLSPITYFAISKGVEFCERWLTGGKLFQYGHEAERAPAVVKRSAEIS